LPDPVPFVDLASQHAPLRAELAAAFERVVDGSAFILGEEVERFEEEFAAYCGVRHCVGVASGTAALTLAVTAAGIGPGDEVIVPAHTFIASALGVIHAGATPVLCDVEDGTGLIDCAAAEAVINEQTAAILPVHLYGQVCDMDAIAALAQRHGLAVIEDAAQAHGATHRGRRAGSLGTAAAFSFYPSKNLGALGDGGAVTTDDDEVAAGVRVLRDLGQRAKGEHVAVGHNERLDGLQAALLRVKLPHLDRWNSARREAASAYTEVVGEPLALLEEGPETPCIFHLFPVRAPQREALARRLGEADVATAVHYSPAMGNQPALAGRVRAPEAAPNAAAWAAEELSLPIFEGLAPERARSVGQACMDALATALTTD
jgi:dTDP-4-amino-4,6-dideoxygalactose transaminase